jgi:formylglycine-generating enzyme required for sulfatase activity
MRCKIARMKMNQQNKNLGILLCLLIMAASNSPARADTITPAFDAWIATASIPGRHYRMMKYDVTFDLWNLCLEQGGCEGYHPDDQGWGQGNHPVINISFDDAVLFAQWLSRYTGKHFRLPTDEEWEYAAHGGTDTNYWWGDNPDCGKAAYGLLANAECSNQEFKTKTVGSYPPNPYGLYDISGNVWQWTSTCPDPDCQKRTLRGGSFIDASTYLNLSFKGSGKANLHYMVYGFRLVEDK